MEYFMKTKRCSKCKKIKEISKFYRNRTIKDGHSSQCKNCSRKWYLDNSERIREYKRKYYLDNFEYINKWNKKWAKGNPEKRRESSRKYYLNNPEKCREARKKYRENNPDSNRNYYKNNRARITRNVKKWYKNNPEKRREICKRWIENNPEKARESGRKSARKRNLVTENRLSSGLAVLIRYSLRSNKNGKHWEDLVGYSLQDLKIHLEKLFKRGMTWDNYGRKGWSIDHKIPISYFEFNSFNDWEFRYCWSLDNLQPLWHKENILKRDKIIRY